MRAFPLCVFYLVVAVLLASSAQASPSSSILITAVYPDPPVNGERSEAVEIQNVGGATISLGDWQLSDGEATASFAAGAGLAPGQRIWVSRSAAAFALDFGFDPAYEIDGDSNPAVPDLSGAPFSLNNSGDEVYLKDTTGAVADAVAYGLGQIAEPDWRGAAVQPLTIPGVASEGQILYRKRDEAAGLPVPDTNTSADWAQDRSDPVNGKKWRYPGWDLDAFFMPIRAREDAEVKYCVAPDHLYACVREELLAATRSISIELYALDSPYIVAALTERLDAGVAVSLLLDGSALEAQGKWACQELEAHGGQCWLMAAQPQAQIRSRYDSLHVKAVLIDRARLLVGSENLSEDALPADDKRDGTMGSRGGFLITDSRALASAVQTILDRDFDPARHRDVRRWGTYADDFPPFGFAPDWTDGGTKYRVEFATPFASHGRVNVELVQCPENCLRASDGVLGLIARAGRGDTLLAEQLYEYPFWGSSASTPGEDPNLRLEGYLAAARRGARVRLLLDSFYDTFSNPRSNYATCAYVNTFAPAYDVECRLGNPTGRGIHQKMILLRHESTGFVHLGSINGSETSNKLNRELAVQVESPGAYEYWASVFEADWRTTQFAPHRRYLPLLWRKAP